MMLSSVLEGFAGDGAVGPLIDRAVDKTGEIMRADAVRLSDLGGEGGAVSSRAEIIPRGEASVLAVPIKTRGRFLAVLELERRGSDWDDDDLYAADFIGGIFSVALTRRGLERQAASYGPSPGGANNIQSEFLSRMSHEMRTPMNAIVGMTSIAKKTDDVNKKDFCLDKISAASKRLLDVINDIFDMSKIGSGKFRLSYSKFEIEEMIVGISRGFGAQICEKEQSFTAEIDAGVPASLIGDGLRLSQVISHLLSNSIKFTPNKGEIKLRVILEEDSGDSCTLKIEVADNGIGIRPDMQEKLFDAYEQGDGGFARRHGGIGLGLFLSKKIVGLMGGDIRYESEPGRGTVFIFTVNMKKGEKRTAGVAKTIRAFADSDIVLERADRSAGPYDAEIRKEVEMRMENGIGNAAGGGYAGIIDVEGGLRRLANNKKLYFKLLSNFKGPQMAEEVVKGITEGDHVKISQAAHAIKGVASNLGLDQLADVARTIDDQARMKVIVEDAADMINSAAENAAAAIRALLLEEGAG